MNRELNLSAKKYNFLQKLQLNYFVDAIDESRWKVAKIVAIKNVGHRHTITLHFDGYLSNWDQDFDLPASNKLAPFRRFTLPYTGPTQLNRNINRPPANLNFQGPLADLKRINKPDKQKLKPEWIIQNFRGQLFILVDTLLTQNIKLKLQQYEQVFKFLDAYIQTSIGILRFALQKINQISKQNINDPNVIYVNSTYALVSSLPQILFNLNSLVSVKERRVKIFNFLQNSSEQTRKNIRNVLKSKSIIQICRSIIQYQNPPYRSFPWSTKKQVLLLLSGLQEQVQFPKIVDNRQISQALDVLGYLKQKQVFNDQTIQNLHIQIVVNLILSGTFEGKLKGMAELKRFCEGTNLRKQVLKQKILTPQIMNALTDNSTFNSQIFKRSIPFFEAAAKYDLISDQVIKRIINLHKDKHELELKSYFSTLSQFGQILNQKRVLQLFEELKKFKINVDTINLIKDYTLNVIKRHPVYRKRYMQPNSGLGLVYLWQIIKQQNSEQVVTSAILAFSILAGDSFYKQVIQKYLFQCFTNIKAGKNVESSLKIIHSCLNKNKQLASLIDIIDKQFNIIDTVIKSLIEAPALSRKTVQSIFQFLEEVNQFTRKKITVDHIKDLWNLKQCQKSLLKFVRKYAPSSKQRSNDKIINKKLHIVQIKQIVSKIFMNKALMENYANIDEQTYKAIDQLLISYNHRSKNIEYNVKHSIRWINIQQVFGNELYLEIAMNCKDEKLANMSLKRFIQYYLRPYTVKGPNSVKNDKVGVWLYCAQKLTKHLDQSLKKYIGYSILFQQIKGRMFSLNFTDPTDSVFSVMTKSSNIRKTISISRCSSLWKMRQHINNQFKLNKTNFDMIINSQSNYPTDMQKEQDYSVIFVDPPKDPQSVAVTIIQSKQPHPHYIAIQQFKNNFSQLYAQKIYDSLTQIKSLNIQLICLKILTQIPIIRNLQSKLSKMQIGKQITWDQVLDPECRAKLSYQISVLNKVKSQGVPWVIGFIKKGGVEHIQKILRLRVLSKTPLVSKDYQFYSELLQFFMQLIQFYKMHQTILPFNEASVIEIMKISGKDKSNPQLFTDTVFLDYFYQTFITLKQILKYQNIDGGKILSNPNIQQVIQMLLFTDKKTDKKTDYQERFPKILQQVFLKCKGQELLSTYCQSFLKNCLSNPKAKYTCRVFFDLLVIMFDNNFVTNSLYFWVLQFIKNVRYASPQLYSQKQNRTNQIIHGWLRISKCLIFKSITTNNELKSIPESQQKFAEFLITQGLFKENPRFESQKCRDEAFEILSQLTCNKYVMDRVGNQVNTVLVRASWRKQYQWFLKSYNRREAGTKVGLRNLAATCYINSLIQQLFNIKQFRQPLLQVNSKSIQTNENIAYELQKIFAYLKYSNREVYSTQSFCQTFISEGHPIDPRVQMDIDQFFHTLMDKLQHNLMKINKQNIIDDVFKGEYSNLIIGQDCQHKSERIQHFLSMRLDIINKGSLTQALSEFIKGEILQGQNAYFCDKCDKKVKALKRVCIKTLPNILILTLKRFQFDFEKMQKFKLNSFCQFGEDLDMEPYMRQYLYENQERLPKQNYRFKLKGVVIHYGVSQAGHYTSYIRIENGQWKYFDDDKISKFQFQNLGRECFGGIDDSQYSDNTQRIKNAYLLIYQREVRDNVGQLKTNQLIKSEVDLQNLNNQQIKLTFEHGLQNFYDSNSMAFGKSYLLFVHLVSLRSDQRQSLFKKCYQNCIKLFQSNISLVQWYLQQFSENMIREFLIFGFHQASLFVASLLIYCVGKAFNPDFIKRCMKCVEKKNMVPFTKVFQAASLNNNYTKVLNEYSFHDKIFRIIKQDKIQSQAGLSKIPNIRSQFGQPVCQFFDRKDFRLSIQLIQCIQNFKVKMTSLDDLENFSKKTKKLSMQVSICRYFAPKIKDQQTLDAVANKFLLPYLQKFQPKIQQQFYFRFMIIFMNQLCQIKDDFTKKRIQTVARLYFMAIRDSLEGYKAMRMLLEGLFSLCFNNDAAREEFIAVFNEKDNRKYVKAIRDWMKQADRFYAHVRNDRFGYWRKPGKSSYAQLQKLQSQQKTTPQKYLSLFNSLLQRHKIQFPDLLSPVIMVGERVSFNQIDEFNYEVIEKYGITLKIRHGEGMERLVLEDDVIAERFV